MFRNQEVKKTYRSIVKEKPAFPEVQLEHYLIRYEKQNKSTAFETELLII